MAKQYIMSLMAVDRVGILAALTNALDDLGGNILELSQAVIRRFFTMIVAVEFPADRDPEIIVEHIRSVCRPFGVEVSFKDPSTEMIPAPMTEATSADRYVLTITGIDRKGALRKISRRLAQEGIDIIDLHGVSHEGEHNFSAFMELVSPQGVDLLKIVQELQLASREENLNLTLQHRAILQATSRPEPPPRSF
ncbi:MAG: ACT domain-containing protein [Planctomycetaceae bacterium]